MVATRCLEASSNHQIFYSHPQSIGKPRFNFQDRFTAFHKNQITNLRIVTQFGTFGLNTEAN